MSKTTKRFSSKDGKIKPPTNPTSKYIAGKAKSRTVSAVKPTKST